jgi:hypothetical protein
MVTPRQQQATSDKMKKYVDPRTGTVSYSGADMTAVVFLPMSADQLTAHIAAKTFELQEMRADLAEMSLAEIQADGGAAYLALSDEIYNANLEVERLGKLFSKGGRYTRPVKLLDLQTLSISSHREKFPVRTLGRVNPKSRTRGPRTIAGSLIFTLFNKAALWDLLEASSNFYSSGVGVAGTDSGYPELETVLVDQIPPFDITIMCSNELGDNSYMVLYGVEIGNEGQTLSIQDIITEDVMQFTALDFEPMRPLTQRRQSLLAGVSVITPDNLVEEARTERQRRGIRLNPFI